MTEIRRFGRSFQEAVAANCYKHIDVLSLCVAYIPLDYFDSAALSELVGLAYNHYRRYRVLPTRSAVVELLVDKAESGKISIEELRGYTDIADRLLTARVNDREFVRDRLSAFIRQTSMSEALIKAVDLFKEGNYGQIVTDVRAASMSGNLTLGHNYGASIRQRAVRRNMLEDEGIPTLIPDLDHALNGGLRRKELGVLMGPPGRGKSVGLNHFSKANMIIGGTGAHATLEMSEERIADRLDSSLSGVPHRHLRDNSDLVLHKLDRLVGNKVLYIKEWPMKRATPDTIRAWLDQLIGVGIIPSLLCVDYGDILKSLTSYKERRHDVASNFEELRAIAQEYVMPVWTATQANRSSLSKEVITMADIAESFEKCAIADVIISICQTDDEQDRSMLRLFLAKNRDNPSGYAVGPFFCDFTRMTFYQREDPRDRKRLMQERSGEVMPSGARRIR